MAWKKSDENAVEEAVKNWMSINETEDPVEFKAWKEWRRLEFGCRFVPKNYTVPSAYPPSNQAAANDYAMAIKLIRKSINWSMKDGGTPITPKPWR